jgi:glutamine amidotransferase
MVVTILDLNLGNLKSIYSVINSLSVKIDIKISNDISVIDKSDKLIISGVGSFDTAVNSIDSLNLRHPLNEFRNSGKPILGICLGMQLMTKSSDEGILDGLGWVDGNCKKFNNSLVQVPHMGWNIVHYDQKCPLFSSIPHFTENHPRFYFVHSYYVDLNNESYKLGKTDYGIKFTSSFSKGNLFGVQFHPEKSLNYGISLFNNFLNL